jgi:polyhydroxyalkanoate synthase
MPAAMHSFYLRNMYQENLLVKPGGITLDGVPIDLHKIKTPSFLLSTREDHGGDVCDAVMPVATRCL